MNTLFLHISTHGETCQAWVSGPQGFTHLGRDSIEHLSQRYPGSACVVFLPSSFCLFTSVIASAKQLRQANQSLAWLIEEQTGDDVENLHVIAGPTQAADETPVIAINKTTLQEQLAQLREHGLHPIAALPDLLLLARDNNVRDSNVRDTSVRDNNAPPLGEWLLGTQDDAQNNSMMVLRTGLLSGAVLEADALELMLQGALLERREQTPLTLSAMISDTSLRERVQAWAAAQTATQAELELHFSDAQPLEQTLTATTDWAKHPANLLQGSFALTQKFSLPPGLRIAAVFIAVTFALQLLSEWIYAGYYHYQAEKTQAAATTLYKQMFPQERHIVNLRRQLKTHMAAGENSGSALPVLTKVAESLQGSNLSAQRVDFAGGALTLDVNAPALGDIDNFKQKLESQGFHAEIVSANAQSGVIRGRLRVGAGA
jgi:type II secretion system protein L